MQYVFTSVQLPLQLKVQGKYEHLFLQPLNCNALSAQQYLLVVFRRGLAGCQDMLFIQTSCNFYISVVNFEDESLHNTCNYGGE